jgi:hypothetical protein
MGVFLYVLSICIEEVLIPREFLEWGHAYTRVVAWVGRAEFREVMSTSPAETTFELLFWHFIDQMVLIGGTLFLW